MKSTPNVASESCDKVLTVLEKPVIPHNETIKESKAESPPLDVWVLSEGVTDVKSFMEACDLPTHHCSKLITSHSIRHQMPQLIQQLRDDQPDLLWIALPQKTNTPSRETVAIQVLMYEQLRAGRHVVHEASTLMPTDSLFREFPQLRQTRVWWCTLGLQQSCKFTFTVTSFDLPNRYMTCCGKTGGKRKKGILPKSTPQGYFVLVVKMLREALSVHLSSPQPDSQVVAHVAKESQLNESAFPTNAKEKRKKLKATGAKTLTVNDGPGEHEDVVPLKPCKFIESHYDDCGDDLGPITIPEESNKTLMAHFDDVQSTTYVESDVVESSDDDVDWSHDLDQVLDSEFVAWHLPGSEDCDESKLLQQCPHTNWFHEPASMFAVLNVTPGRHDVVELFGGEGKCLKLAVRRQLVSGVNFDVTCDMDLDKPQQIAQFWNYMLKHKPRVAIMGQ